MILPQTLVDVMARQAEAERERQARVTLATAEYDLACGKQVCGTLHVSRLLACDTDLG